MVDETRNPNLVGAFIRQRREALGLSQKSLGQMFSPPVTTQFISNVERGVTPLPPNHVSTLTRTLLVTESELMGLLEKEYTAKLSGRLGRAPTDMFVPDGQKPPVPTQIVVAPDDYEFMRGLYDAFRQATLQNRQAFVTVCESILGVKPKPGSGNPQGE